jgi:hypothetical protein
MLELTSRVIAVNILTTNPAPAGRIQFAWVAHASRVLVAVSRRNGLSLRQQLSQS